MTEEKTRFLSEKLTTLCHRDAELEETCPTGGDDCPFPEKLCENITPEDWKAWMEADNGN